MKKYAGLSIALGIFLASLNMAAMDQNKTQRKVTFPVSPGGKRMHVRVFNISSGPLSPDTRKKYFMTAQEYKLNKQKRALYTEMLTEVLRTKAVNYQEFPTNTLVNFYALLSRSEASTKARNKNFQFQEVFDAIKKELEERDKVTAPEVVSSQIGPDKNNTDPRLNGFFITERSKERKKALGERQEQKPKDYIDILCEIQERKEQKKAIKKKIKIFSIIQQKKLNQISKKEL